MRTLSIIPVLFVVGCASSVAVPGTGPALVARLACPARAEPGVPFTVDGSTSSAPIDGFASVSLTLVGGAGAPGDQASEELTATFTVDAPAVATARLVVTDATGVAAEARCRIPVGDVVDDEEPLPVDEEPAGGDPADDENTLPDEGPRGEPVDLTGRFVLLSHDAPEVAGGALDPSRQCGATPHIALVDVVQAGSHVSMTMTSCVVSMPRVQIFLLGVQETAIPDALVDALPSVGPIEMELERAETGARFAPFVDGRAVWAGANLATSSDPLPTAEDDPVVVDADGDGAPGVTIQSTPGDQRIVYRRTMRALSGVIESNDVIDGSAPGSWQVDTESSLLSFLSFLVPTGAGMPSTFRMVRTDLESCDEVRANVAALASAFPASAAPADCPAF